MKKMTVGELSKLYGIHRQSIYKRINKGDLSKSADGKVDFEPYRVCRRVNILRDYSDEKTKLYPRN